MKYFYDADRTIKVLEYAKKSYKEPHDDFHKFNLQSLGADYKKDDLRTFFRKVVLMDIQSRPQLLSKYRVLKIYDDLEKIDFKKIFSDEESLIQYFYDNLISIKGIGGKICTLILKNVFYYGDTERYFGFKRDRILSLLETPIDVHIKNLLCYRLQLSPIELYNKISSNNSGFQKELKSICESSDNLVPIDLDILWYVGYLNCNRRVYCSNCKMKRYCKDTNFEIETGEKVKDKKRSRKEIKFVKNHKEIVL